MRQDQEEPYQRRSADALAVTGRGQARHALFDAVLLDRDGTLIEDVPYNGDPDKVRPVPGARAALDRLRAAGLRLGVVTNQSGLARGLFTARQLARCTRRVEELLGPFDTWQVCPHDDARPAAPAASRAPGLVHAAARALGTVPDRCVLIGDIGRDMTAALAAGAAGVLVPTAGHPGRGDRRGPRVAADLPVAVDGDPAPPAALSPASRGRARRRRGSPDAASWWSGRDSAGDVLVTGPAIRAVAAEARIGWCCCAGRAVGPPPTCCPASTRSSSSRCPGSTPHPGRSIRGTSAG